MLKIHKVARPNLDIQYDSLEAGMLVEFQVDEDEKDDFRNGIICRAAHSGGQLKLLDIDDFEITDENLEDEMLDGTVKITRIYPKNTKLKVTT